METSSDIEELLQIKCYTCSSREMNLIKYEIFRTIRSVRRYQETLWWKLSVLLSSCLKDFPSDNGNDGFRGFHGFFLFLPWFMPLVLLLFFCVLVFFSLAPLSQLSGLGRCFCCWCLCFVFCFFLLLRLSVIDLVIFCLNFFHWQRTTLLLFGGGVIILLHHSGGFFLNQNPFRFVAIRFLFFGQNYPTAIAFNYLLIATSQILL